MNGGSWEHISRTTATMNTETTEYKIEFRLTLSDETTKYIIEGRNLTQSDVFTAIHPLFFYTYEKAVEILREFKTMIGDRGIQYRLVKIHRNKHGTSVTVLDV